MLPVSDTSIAPVAHIIQVAVAPVFLLTGIGSILGVLISRLARIVDRARSLEQRPATAAELRDDLIRVELVRLNERRRWVNRAISLCTLCALLVCSVIATLFVGAFVTIQVGEAIALLFIAAMLALIAGLVCFLREIFIAVNLERTPRSK